MVCGCTETQFKTALNFIIFSCFFQSSDTSLLTLTIAVTYSGQCNSECGAQPQESSQSNALRSLRGERQIHLGKNWFASNFNLSLLIILVTQKGLIKRLES